MSPIPIRARTICTVTSARCRAHGEGEIEFEAVLHAQFDAVPALRLETCFDDFDVVVSGV